VKKRIANLLYCLDVLRRCSSSPQNYLLPSQYSNSDRLETLWYNKDRQRRRLRRVTKLAAIHRPPNLLKLILHDLTTLSASFFLEANSVSAGATAAAAGAVVVVVVVDVVVVVLVIVVKWY